MVLTDIYNWFAEGFDTADLQTVKTLVDDLSAELAATWRPHPTQRTQTLTAGFGTGAIKAPL